VISSWGLAGNDLRFAMCSTSTCVGTPTRSVLDAAGDVGRRTTIAIGASGFPTIAYADDTYDTIKVAVVAKSSWTRNGWDS
jgi:hypothetical protein